ncbi:inositol 1,4,5-trisphosphate receptor-interacting protein-like 1 [Rhynochetos jubatus]
MQLKIGIICHPPQLCTLPVCRRAPEASSLGTIRKPSPSHVAPDPAAHAEALHDIVQLRQLHTTGKESGDYGGHKGDFHAAFSSHCHDGGGELRGAEKLPGRSGWAGTKQEALRMCLPVLSGAPVENLPLPDAPQGVTAARRDMLDTEKTVLCRHCGSLGLCGAEGRGWLAGVPVMRSGACDITETSHNGGSNTQEEVEVHEVDSEDALGRSFAKRIPWPVQNLAYRSRVMEELAGDLLRVFHMYFSGSFFPVLQPVIRVGSTFEGWSPREEDARYRLLLPLQPPRGHAFRLELGTAGEMPAKDSRVRVALECICRRPELVDDTLCFLHHPEEELRENQAPSLLHTLCTGSYLDAQKTARWFQDTVRSAWGVVPLSRLYKMNLLPSSRSCKMQLISTSGRSLFAEIIFGVQLGVSDIFLSSQPAEPGLIPSTRWPQSCVVAEAKFFRVMARQAPRDSFHLKCLQICARILEGTAFSTYTFKTAVMHLLTTTPLSDWRRRHFMLRLEDIMRYLDDCLKEKRLNHFFFGNEHVPEEIILPPAFPTAEPPNLFQHLAQDPAAHARAMTEFDELQNRLTSLLFYGR